MRIILASASTSRARLLQCAGVAFEIAPANIDEDALKDRMVAAGADPDTIASELAEHKAHAVSITHPSDLVIAGDQILWFDDDVISKCRTMDEARRLLVRLRGRSHALIGGLILARGGDTLWRHKSRVDLTMRNFSNDYLDQYLDREGGGLLASVGCYRLEGEGVQLFDAIDGSYFAVLGLDILPLLGALRDHGAIVA